MIQVKFDNQEMTSKQWNDAWLYSYQEFCILMDEYSKKNEDKEATVWFKKTPFGSAGDYRLLPEIITENHELQTWISEQINRLVGGPIFRLNESGRTWLD